MGKKNKKRFNQTHVYSAAVNNEAAQEQSAIKKDLIQTVVVNLIFLAVLVALFYWNQSSGNRLDQLITNWIRL